MPTVLRREGLRFFFYSLDRGEPPHIHVEGGDGVAKYWLASGELARSEGFRAHELNHIGLIVRENRSRFLEAWDEHFGP